MLPHRKITRFRRRMFWFFAVLYAAALPVILLTAFGVGLPGTRGVPLAGQPPALTAPAAPDAASAAARTEAVRFTPTRTADARSASRSPVPPQ